MADRTARNRAHASVAKRAPATPSPAATADPAPPPRIVEEFEYGPEPFDAASFDPAEFEWRPVPRRPRADGWTPDVQRAFIQALVETGMVERAAYAVNMSVQSAYRLRHAPGGESFARAWDVATAAAARRVLDLAFQRVIEGEEHPYFDCDGRRIGARRKFSDKLTMFLLRAYMPERFRHAHQDVRAPGETPVPALPSVAAALASLTPPVPADPHLLLPPAQLETMVLGARAVAEVHALHPADERERYVAPRIEPSSDAAIARGRRRIRREIERERREEEAEAKRASAWDEA